MLDKNQEAKFIAFEYPYSANRVRFHRHTDTNELWVVLADICNILGLANVTYTASKVAMATIHSVYEDIHDEEEVSCEEVHKVKKAVEILDMLHR